VNNVIMRPLIKCNCSRGLIKVYTTLTKHIYISTCKRLQMIAILIIK